MLAVRLYDVVLWVHITAVVIAFGALFAYPVFLAVVARAPIAQRVTFHHAQIAFSKRITGPTIGVILLAGVYLATDADLWSETWVTIPFVLLFVIAGLGGTVLRRGEEGSWRRPRRVTRRGTRPRWATCACGRTSRSR